MSMTREDLELLAEQDEIDAVKKHKDQIPNIDGMSPTFSTSLTPLPIFLLEANPQNRNKEYLKNRSDALICFMNTSFEQRVSGNASQLIKEAEEGVISTISQNSVRPENTIFSFKRNIAHYAMYYKWRAVIDYICDNNLTDELTIPDVFGLTPLDYYFMNITANYSYYVIRVVSPHNNQEVRQSSFHGYIPKFESLYNTKNYIPSCYKSDFYIYKLLKVSGLLGRVRKIMECIYYNEKMELTFMSPVHSNNGQGADNVYKNDFVELRPRQFYETLFRVFEDLMTSQSDLEKCDLCQKLKTFYLSIKCWRSTYGDSKMTETAQALPKLAD